MPDDTTDAVPWLFDDATTVRPGAVEGDWDVDLMLGGENSNFQPIELPDTAPGTYTFSVKVKDYGGLTAVANCNQPVVVP